jgi:hypothetical protein
LCARQPLSWNGARAAQAMSDRPCLAVTAILGPTIWMPEQN